MAETFEDGMMLGMLLGRKKGGGPAAFDAVKYIVDNGILVDTIPINEQYHSEIRILYIDRRPYEWVNPSDSRNVYVSDIYMNPLRYGIPYSSMHPSLSYSFLNLMENPTIYLMTYLVLYDNDIPKTAYTAQIKQLTDSINMMESETEIIYMPKTVFRWDLTSLSKCYETASVYSPSQTVNGYNIYYTGEGPSGTGNGRLVITKLQTEYTIHGDSQSGYYYDGFTTTSQEDYVYLPHGLFSGNYSDRMITNLPTDEYLEFIGNVIKAINHEFYSHDLTIAELISPPDPST